MGMLFKRMFRMCNTGAHSEGNKTSKMGLSAKIVKVEYASDDAGNHLLDLLFLLTFQYS